VAKNIEKRSPNRAAQSPHAPDSAPKRRATGSGSASPATPNPAPVTAIAQPKAEPYAERDSQSPLIVGVGASAGGLDAFTELLANLPSDTGLAFVLIQHLDPAHESHLTELLSKISEMPVSEVEGETRAEANHVYVIPPRSNLGVSNGILLTPPRPDKGRNMPIDYFLRDLAADKGSRAVGVVLSGTGSDGTLGLDAIKTAGGVTFAQNTRSAKFGDMPASAIATGTVDFVLPPAGIAQQLVAISNESVVPPESWKPADPPEGDLRKLFRILRTAVGVDFTNYKRSTLQRRIKRRMALRGFETLEDYIRELEQNREESTALCESFFITVTKFFREPAVFDELKKKIFPALVENRGLDDAIRIWVPGCSTGEEAYSIAICLKEYLDEAKLSLRFELFATDISQAAIEKARAGIYTDAALAHVSPERVARFFDRAEHGWRVSRAVREACVFAQHNVAQDPPFSRVDLLSCCNVLIYLEAALQRKVLAILHYALKPAGFLMLGPSESIGALSQLFHQVAKTHKIYRKVAATPTAAPPVTEGRPAGVGDLKRRTAEGRTRQDVQREADRLVLAEHSPPGVVIDDGMNVIQVRGHTDPYLLLPPGEPTRNLLKMAREGLIAGLITAVRTARQTNAIAKEDGFRTVGDQLIAVTVTVIPFAGWSSSEGRYFLILFADAGRNGAAGEEHAPSVQGDQGTTWLRRELAATREHLQSIVDDKATTLEELKTANEEAQAGNEELESAQEELESANEELNTLNEELKTGNIELSQVNRDLTNLLESISIPLVMVGRDLRIRRFTRAMEPLLSLIASDVGRPITDFQPQMELPDLRRLLADAMEGGNRKPRDVRDSHGRWYSLRILPSVGPDGKTTARY
jgi:two-component system CheB/CheR fusion protein